MNKEILVSVVIPAYKFQYLERALNSISIQTYPMLELIICDDSADNRIKDIVEKMSESVNFAICYMKNETRIGELAGTAKGIKLAKGKYIKFLHDDDELEPDCIASLVAVMENEADIALASSRRRRIDDEGEPLPDILATSFPFSGDVIINGKELVSFLGDHTINFIGEPSCILARRDDLLEIADELMSLDGNIIHWVGDLALYAKLLQKGNLAFLAQPLTRFRVSRAQYSQAGRDRANIGEKWHVAFRQAVRNLGWYRTNGNNRLVQVAPITRVQTRLFKPVDLLASLQRAYGLGSVTLSNWLGARYPSPAQQQLIEQRLTALNGGPRIAVVLLDRTGAPEAIARTLDNLEQVNLYRNVEAWVCSPLPLSTFEGRAKTVRLESGCECADVVNRIVAETEADWVLLTQAGSEFLPSGLLMAALDLPTLPDTCHAAYADELVRHGDDALGILLRPDMNLDLLLSSPAGLSAHWLFRRATLLEQSGFKTDCGQAFELDYQLRLIEQFGLGSIGHIAEPLLTATPTDVADAVGMQTHSEQRQAVIRQHLQRRGYKYAVVNNHLPGCHQIDYGHDAQPVVSILIVVHDRLLQIQRCLETLLENTGYAKYEVLLLDHGNHESAIRNWLDGIAALNSPQLRVLRFDAARSRASICNEAAQQARGDFLLWLEDGAGLLHKDWLQQLLNHALRSEVGAVGAKLLSADGTIRHAGLLLGLHGPVGRAFEGLAHNDSGYMYRLQVEQNYAALSGECLMLRRELFLQTGGFDEEPLLARWTDVDLCLKLQQAGYLNVWTPRATLLMDMPPDTAAGTAEEDAMYARWLPVLAHDPSYNRGFSLQEEQAFRLAEPELAWQPLQSWRPLPTVLAHHADLYGCGHYRVIQPALAMADAGLIDVALTASLLLPAALERHAPDAIVLQRQTTPERIEAMRRIKTFSRAFKVYELDDYLPNLPMKHQYRQRISQGVLKLLRQSMGMVDRFVVSTEALKEAFAGLHPDIRVIENRLPVSWWSDLQSRRRISGKPRVGWAGSASHSGDLEMIADVVRELANEVEWVFFGMCPAKLRPFIHEYHPGVPITQYPQALAGLDLDLALAPVEDNLFNQCKSNLRLLEYGACGFPVICSDVRCYQGTDLPVTRVKNRFRDWVDAIRMHLADLDATARMGDELRQAVRKDWMLEGEHLHAWRKVWLPD
ncbi:glycosyltransferase [Oxalicibacterium solurbis]|uniref:O-antigen biosynthesis protein n=1 Tax=Oxalicibacterium solurbis TaxID=69280 RepID=A0A8J3FAC6_9BURK|nr:glycosyltransferase [Oxalicibacterium solurbis]GGI55593.1 O-antigen biosynthesis protein [Oxalicibacterium solurbis]